MNKHHVSLWDTGYRERLFWKAYTHALELKDWSWDFVMQFGNRHIVYDTHLDSIRTLRHDGTVQGSPIKVRDPDWSIGVLLKYGVYDNRDCEFQE